MKLILLMLLVSCGNSKLDVKDSKHTVDGSTNHNVDGEVRNILIVELPFISQVNELCKDLYLINDYTSIELYNQEVAQCTFDNISILNIEGLSPEGFESTIDDICMSEEYQDQPICQ